MGQHRISAKRSRLVTEHPSEGADTFLEGESNLPEKEGVGWLSFNLIRLLVSKVVCRYRSDTGQEHLRIEVNGCTLCRVKKIHQLERAMTG